ncbi:WAS/WASL-interacting protein family member 1 [Penaeus vannamei]|uniref:WAS/WASL-interacting protein family member 1 n=1 Tax=Penaeus vannamei TaxID=6689 RepID=UPI00387F5521
MRALVLAVLVAAAAAYGPPSNNNNNNPFTRNNCGSGGCGQVASSGCSSGCSGGQRFTKQTFSCGGSGCGGCSGSGCVQPPLSVSGQYWWEGDDSPFKVPPGHRVTNVDSSCGGAGCTASVTTCGGSGCPPAHSQRPQNPQPQRPSFNPAPPAPQPPRTPRPVSATNLVMPPMGICPASFVCVHWQLCRDGFVITDGTGAINKQIKEIPAQVSSRYRSCGTNMVCCGVPSFRPPPAQSPTRAPVPPPPSSQRPPAPQAPPSFQQPPAPQAPPSFQQPPAPQAPPSFQQPPAPIPTRRPQAPVPSSGGYASPTVPQNPLRPAPQPPARPPRPNANNGFNSQPTVVNQAGPVPPAQTSNARPRPQPPRQRPPQPNVPISNPIGLVSPPSPQPMGMMGGMMGGMMPMVGGTCSAGTYCVAPNQCNPYTGFIITDPTQLMAVWPDAPTVPLLPCFVPGAGQIQDGVCCQQAHPRAGGLD